jgi:hypothetical protein
MSNTVIETVTEETTNLALHVQLCEQRYLQLLNKFDQVDARLDQIAETLGDINERIGRNQHAQLQTYLAWAGVVITALAGGIFHLLTLIK